MDIILTESQIRKILTEEYSEKVVEQLVSKFKQEEPDEDESVIRAFIKRFDRVKGDSGIQEKDIFKYSFNQLRLTLINYFKEVKPKSYKGDTDMDVVYDSNNMVIYRADSRSKCIKYGEGYSFCISSYTDTASYGRHIIKEKGTPYFIFNRNFSNKQASYTGPRLLLLNKSFESPEHLLVIIVHDASEKPLYGKDSINFLNFEDGGRINTDEEYNSVKKYYSVSDANNLGEKYYVYFDNIVKKYPFLRGLENIFRVEALNEKDVKYYQLNDLGKKELKKINEKYALPQNIIGAAPEYYDSCDDYLPVFFELDDITSRPVRDPFIKGEYYKYMLIYRSEGESDTVISRHFGRVGYDKCVEDLKEYIEKNRKEYNTFKNSPASDKNSEVKNNMLKRWDKYMDPENYRIKRCDWPEEYVDYLKDIYSMGSKFLYQKWLVSNS